MSAPIDHAEIRRAMAMQIVPMPIEGQRLSAVCNRIERIALTGLQGFASILGTACVVAQILKRIAL